MALPLGGQTGLPCPEALLYEACSPSVSLLTSMLTMSLLTRHAHHVFTDEACSPCPEALLYVSVLRVIMIRFQTGCDGAKFCPHRAQATVVDAAGCAATAALTDTDPTMRRFAVPATVMT